MPSVSERVKWAIDKERTMNGGPHASIACCFSGSKRKDVGVIRLHLVGYHSLHVAAVTRINDPRDCFCSQRCLNREVEIRLIFKLTALAFFSALSNDCVPEIRAIASSDPLTASCTLGSARVGCIIRWQRSKSSLSAVAPTPPQAASSTRTNRPLPKRVAAHSDEAPVW